MKTGRDMKKFVALLLFLLVTPCFLVPTPVIAGDLAVSATVDRNSIRLDEQLVLELNVSGGKAEMPSSLPDIPNFTVNSAGRSESISIINGSMSQTTALRFILTPRAAGKFTIPSIVLSSGGKAYQTQPITVEVLAAGAAPARSRGRGR